MLRLNQANLDQYLKKTEAEQIYMKKINSINMSFTSILTSIQSLVATYDYQFSTLNNRVGQIESDTSNLNIDISNLKLWTQSAYSSITSLENQTLFLNNEFYSIKTNTDQIASNTLALSNLISTLTGGLGYDYWNEFSKVSNETYMDYAINSTVVKNEQITFNGNLSQSISNADKKEFVFNQNLLNTIFTVENPVARLGLKLNSTNQPLRATANTIDIAAYQNISLNDSFNLKCSNLNLINSGGNINSIGSNIFAQNISFNNFNTSTFYLNLNPNVENLINLPTAYVLNITNNGNNTLTLSGSYKFMFRDNQDETFKNFNISSGVSMNKEGGHLLVSNVSFNNSLYYSANCDSFTFSNDTLGYFRCSQNTVNGFKIIGCSGTGNNYFGNYFGHASISLSNNTLSKATVNNPGFLDMVNNTIQTFVGQGNLNGDQFTFNHNTIDVCTLSLGYPGANGYVFEPNTISQLYLTLNQGSVYGFSNLVNTSRAYFYGENYKVYSLIKNEHVYNYIGNVDGSNIEFLSITHPSFRINNNARINVGSFWNLTIFCDSYSNQPVGGWRYVYADYINYMGNSSVFFCNMLNMDNGLFHVKIPRLWDGVEGAFQNVNNTLDFASEVLVDNPITTSVNLMITPNANRKIHANFMSLQPSIKSINFKGWLPSQIVDFDQVYMFNNVASDLVNENVNFTLNVDAVSDWVNYKQFFNPFGDNNPDRIIIDQN